VTSAAGTVDAGVMGLAFRGSMNVTFEHAE